MLRALARNSLFVAIAAVAVLSPSTGISSFPPDIKVTLEGWTQDGKTFVLRKTVVDTGDDSVAEDLLYVVELSSSGARISRKEAFTPDALARFALVKADTVRSSSLGVRTFMPAPGRYIYVSYDTVIEDVEENTPRYTIHRRIWMLDNGMTLILFKEDESFSKVSERRERAEDAYLSPDATTLVVLFDVTSHFQQKGFVVLDLSRARLVENKIRMLD